MNGHDLTAEYIVETSWEALPDAVKRKAHMCLVDNAAAAIGGVLAEVSKIASQYAVDTWGEGNSTVLVDGRRIAAVGAAFANGWTANALDVDDGIQYAYGHGGAQFFPTALAVAEALDLGGADLLASMVVGYEVAMRVGRCWHDHQSIYQACGSWGSVGCAAVAANLMGLTTAQTKHALGIAEYHAPNLPMMRDVDDPGMVKHGIGWGAMTGVVSSELASRGFTGIPSILGFDEYQDWVSDIGQEYLMIDGVAWKSKGYGCCSWAQPAMKAAYQLVEEHDIHPEQIAKIHVVGFHDTVRLGTDLPTTTEEAQFNVSWPVAAMLVDGEVGPAQTLEARLDDPQVRALAQKVEVEEAEDLNELCRLYELGDPRGRFAGRVRLTLKDGRELRSGTVETDECYPPVGWDEERMGDKFRWLASHVLDDQRVDTILDMLWHFEDVRRVRELTGMITRA